MLVSKGMLSPMYGARGISVPSHSLYTDDIIIFYKGTKKNIDALMSPFDAYIQYSSQFLSLSKCKFYSRNFLPSRVAAISNALGFQVGHPPFTYLVYLSLLVSQGKVI